MIAKQQQQKPPKATQTKISKAIVIKNPMHAVE